MHTLTSSSFSGFLDFPSSTKIPLRGLIWSFGCNRSLRELALIHSIGAVVACKQGDLFVLRPEKAIDVARGEDEELPLKREDRREDEVLVIPSEGQRVA